MYNALFYIFSGIAIAGVLTVAFSKSLTNSIYSKIIVLFSLGGIFTLLNSELISFLWIVISALILTALLMFSPKLMHLDVNESVKNLPHRTYYVVIASLTCALISSIVSSTRWTWFNINFEINSFSLLFTKYLPIVLILVILTSVILSSFSFIIRKDETN